MPFVDEGWFCERSGRTCLWSEEAVEQARWDYVEEVHPPTAFCYAGAPSDDFFFRRCGRTLEFCNRVRASDPDADTTKGCRDMTPTEFWRENPMTVELYRKSCKPQKCPAGYHWVGAAKLRGDRLEFAAEPIAKLEGGFFAVPSAEGKPRGYLLREDGECTYGCELGCPLDTFACQGSTCRRCFAAEDVSAAACQSFLEECAAVMEADPEERRLCTTDGARRCPPGNDCVQRYSDAVPEEIRLQGTCRPEATR